MPVKKEKESSISDYEQIRLENIQRNQEFMATLGLDSVKSEIATTVKHSATKKGAQSKKRMIESAIPTRRSSRVTTEKLKSEILEAKTLGNSELLKEKEELLATLESKKLEGSYEAVINESTERAVRSLNPISVFPARNLPDEPDEKWGSPVFEMIKSFKATQFHAPIAKIDNYEARINNLDLAESDVAKIVNSRITSLAFHPSKDKLLLFAGDKEGYVGIWDIDKHCGQSALTDEDGVYRYKPHVSNVATLHCWYNKPNLIYSVSYDGTVRCLDAGANQFDLIYATSDDDDYYVTDACFCNDTNNILIGKSDGEIGCIDYRASKNFIWSAKFQERKVVSIQEHPTNENILMSTSSGMGGKISFHDIRKLKETKKSSNVKELNSLDLHSKSINAAYMSGDGEHIVSVSQDNTIKLVNNFLDNKNQSVYKINHDNHTGRWLSTFKHSFDPKNPNVFVVGSMERPRQIEIFNINKKKCTLEPIRKFKSDFLGSVCSRNIFHPTLDIIAGGNSSGRVHIIRSK